MSKDGASEGTSEWKYVLKRALGIIITITNILSPSISSLPSPSVLGRYSSPSFQRTRDIEGSGAFLFCSPNKSTTTCWLLGGALPFATRFSLVRPGFVVVREDKYNKKLCRRRRTVCSGLSNYFVLSLFKDGPNYNL